MALNVNEIMGARHLPAFVSCARQNRLVAIIREVAAAAPMFHPQTRSGKNMSVKMTSMGNVGWYSDRRGYRYEKLHPSGRSWPSIPFEIVDLWTQITGLDRTPDCCLVNFYGENSKMGLHQDRDESDFCWPVVSVSLGDDALFRIGGTERSDPTKSFWLHSGDVVVLVGQSRLAYHGIDRLKFKSSSLLRFGGRINLTLRVVD